MQHSKRIAAITGGGSDGWDVFYRARAMVAEGNPVVELTIGEHDTPTHPGILDAMHRAARAGHTGYAAVPGIAPLRQAVADRVTACTGVKTTAENVMITAGGQAALFAAHIATCNPGDRALFVDPYYATYPGTIRAAGAVPVPITARPDSGFLPDAEAIHQEAVAAASLLINSPNNPTGILYDHGTLATITDICRETDCWLVSDEVYDTQVWTGTHVSPRALPGMVDRTLVIGSMSKSHAMTGSRIGWIVGPEATIDHLITLSTHTTYGVPGYIQEAALFALGEGPSLEEEIAAPFRRRRAAVLDLIGTDHIVRVVPSGGAMYLMLDIRGTGLSGEQFANRLLDGHGIAVMPGESFGNAAAGHIRIALTVDDDRLMSAMSTLLEFAATLSVVS